LRALFERNSEKNASGEIVGAHFNADVFSELLHRLGVTLRELHANVKVSCDIPINPNAQNQEMRNEDFRAMELVPIYIDSVMTYLRRIADRLVIASRPLLFEHWRSVSSKYKDWVDGIEQFSQHNPTCDFDVLSQAVARYSNWFCELRGISDSTGKKGIRDALEHRNVRLMVGKQQAGEAAPRMTVSMYSTSKDVGKRHDILEFVPLAIRGLCQLMTGFHQAIGAGTAYDREDTLFLVGTDDDVVGFWPEIGSYDTTE
jgi:hypothetical protein